MPEYSVGMVCVGGPAGGRLIQIKQSQSSIRIAVNSETASDRSVTASPTIGPVTYTVRRFAFMGNENYVTKEIRYLALASWTDMEAMTHLLEYYRNYSE